MSQKFHFECVNCKAEYSGEKIIYLCPECQKTNKPGEPPRGILKTIYPYQQLRGLAPAHKLFERLDQDRFLPLLPIRSMNSWPMLKTGETPLYQIDGWEKGQSSTDRSTSNFELYLKDDSQNPTFSFKDRASALVSAWAKEHGIQTLVAASTGNAGSSLAGVCASQGQRALIVVPATAPLAKLTQVLMYGATLIPVRGTYDDAFDLSVKISEKYGFYNRNTAYNPFTIEGKKTVAYELFRQLGQQVPDRVFIPVGDGVIFSGVCKGFEDLLKLGIIDRMPELVGVQAMGSSNLINNQKNDKFVINASKTIADSISVDVPKCFYMTLGYIEKYHGNLVAVSDQEILQSSLVLAHSTGIFSEPAAVAAFAGLLKYHDQGFIPDGSKNVVLLTGSGLKDPGAVQSSIGMPGPVETDMHSVDIFIKSHFL